MIVLAADDSHMIRSLLQGLMVKLFPEDISKIYCEADGAAALDRYRILITEYPQTPLLILMDIDMPIMDGVTAVREIRGIERERDLPAARIMMVTANDDEMNRERSFCAGAEAVIPKPLTPAKMSAYLDGIVSGQSAPSDS